MEYTTLGRTGLKASVAGLGCGGDSKIGQAAGQTLDRSVALIHQAMDLGVNFFDTAGSYGTEKVLGEAIRRAPRDSVVISTKHHAGGVSAGQIVAALDRSLRDLQTDYVDIFHLHGVRLRDYDHALNVLAPALLRERERGADVVLFGAGNPAHLEANIKSILKPPLPNWTGRCHGRRDRSNRPGWPRVTWSGWIYLTRPST